MFSSYELSKKGYTCPDILSTCCMCDCSSLKFQQCVQKYCYCCCPGIFNKQAYPHIEYGRVEPQGDDKELFERESGSKTNLEPVTPVPYERIFQYPQPQRHISIHPQVDSNEDESNSTASVVRQQPHAQQHSEYSDTESEKSGQSIEEMISRKQRLGYSPYGDSMEDIGADIEFVDVAKHSSYVASDVTDSLTIPRRREPSPGVARACSRSPSPLPNIPSLIDVGAELRKKRQLVRQSSPEIPCVHFSLYYNESNQKLIVHLKQVFKLPTSRPEESSNPFAEVYLLPKKNEIHKSHTEFKTHNPVFDETFKFTDLNPHELKRQMVVMRIYNNERNHFVGGVLYSLESASMTGDLIKVAFSEFDEEESLRGFCCGDILLSLCYHSAAKALEISVIEINNLKKSDFIGLSNPYVKINMMHQGQRLLKWKTTVKKSTLMPVFYESTRFNMVDASNIYFVVLIMDHDRVGRNNTLGVVKLGYSVGHTSGERQWQQAFNNPNQSFSTWHCIRHEEKGKVHSPSRRRSKSPSCISVGYQI